MITEPTPVHEETRGPRAQTSGTGAGGGAGAGAGASAPEQHHAAAPLQPVATTQPSAPSSPARRADGPPLAAPAPDPDLAEDRIVIGRATPGPMEAIALGSEGYTIRPATGDMRKRARVAMCGYRQWEEDRANAEMIARAWTRYPQLVVQVAQLQRLARAYLDADSSHAAHQEAERALREGLPEVRR